MREEFYCCLAFSHFLGIGPVRFKALVESFGSAKRAYQAQKDELAKVVGENLAQKFIRFREEFDPLKKEEELRKKEITVIPFYSNLYPASLKNISDPPICLYVRGDANIFSNFSSFLIEARHHDFSPTSPPQSGGSPKSLAQNQVSSPLENFSTSSFCKLFFAIVGTRKPTPYGEQVAKKFARELAQAGFVIVSGMAMGIDTTAHWGAIEVGGKTIAVLGCGVDIIYPAINRGLYEKIVNGAGAVISEFPPGQMVAKGLFVARNRIISGLSDGVLVVEGAEDSGALITARYAGEQGKEVFAAPGPLTSQMSAAPNILIKKGAKLVTSVEDIYEELDVKILPKKKEKVAKDLSLEEKMIFEILAKEPMIIDELAVKIRQPITQILNIVSLLEVKGVIEKNREGKYQVRI
ncbi:MAG: DNA-processing protein DprA [Microgenomates group bacterium]